MKSFLDGGNDLERDQPLPRRRLFESLVRVELRWKRKRETISPRREKLHGSKQYIIDTRFSFFLMNILLRNKETLRVK